MATGTEIWKGTTPVKSFRGLTYNQDRDEIIAVETSRPWDLYIVAPTSGRLIRSFERVVQAPNDSDLSWRGPIYLVDRNELFVGGTVLDAQTGTVIRLEDHFFSNYPPVVTADTMYLSAFKEGVVAFDRADYKVKWIYQPQPAAHLHPLAPIVILDGIGYVIFSDVTVRAFDLESGQELGYWQPTPDELRWWPICPLPPSACLQSARAGLAASENMLFVSFGDGKLYAFGE